MITYQCQNESAATKIVEEVLIVKYVGVVDVDAVGVVARDAVAENMVVMEVDMVWDIKTD